MNSGLLKRRMPDTDLLLTPSKRLKLNYSNSLSCESPKYINITEPYPIQSVRDDSSPYKNINTKIREAVFNAKYVRKLCEDKNMENCDTESDSKIEYADYISINFLLKCAQFNIPN